MAFMGMVFAGIFFFVLGIMVLIGFALLIIGMVTRKKHKTTSNVLFVFSAVNIIIPIGLIIFMLSPHAEEFDTPEGKIRFSPQCISRYKDNLKNGDADNMRKLFDENPKMIYYFDINVTTLLEYGKGNLNIDFMQIALDHGARFDDPYIYNRLIYCCSFESFFRDLDYPKNEKTVLHTAGETTDDIIKTVKFMIENGAAVKYPESKYSQYENFYQAAADWVMRDDYESPKDKELLNIIKDALD